MDETVVGIKKDQMATVIQRYPKTFCKAKKNSAFKTAWSLRKNESKAPPGDDPFGEGIVLNLLEVIFWVYPKVLLNR